MKIYKNNDFFLITFKGRQWIGQNITEGITVLLKLFREEGAYTEAF
jgi:hypothetical protein